MTNSRNTQLCSVKSLARGAKPCALSSYLCISKFYALQRRSTAIDWPFGLKTSSMARSLHKVQKQISKKKGGKPTALHENSRDARRLRQAGAREDKIARIMTVTAKSNQVYVERVAWFQQAIMNHDKPLLATEIQEMVENFIARENDELDEVKAVHRPGRPKSKAEERIQDRIDAEEREFKAGFWVPDMRDEGCLERLRRWGGQWGSLSTLTYIRVVKESGIKPSSFPPKGLS